MIDVLSVGGVMYDVNRIGYGFVKAMAGLNMAMLDTQCYKIITIFGVSGFA